MSTDGVCPICFRPEGGGHEAKCYGDPNTITPPKDVNVAQPKKPWNETHLESAMRRIRDLELENRALNGKLQRLILVVEAALDNARQP